MTTSLTYIDISCIVLSVQLVPMGGFCIAADLGTFIFKERILTYFVGEVACWNSSLEYNILMRETEIWKSKPIQAILLRIAPH